MATATAAAIAAVPTPGAAQETGFPDGAWLGFMSMNEVTAIATPVGDVNTRYVIQGGFDAVARGGGLSGEWALYVNTFLSDADGFISEGSAVAVGPLTGSDRSADLELDLVTASSGGVSFTFTADELPTPGGGTIFVTSAACSSVAGTWEIDFNGDLLTGSFTALPASGDGTEDAQSAAAAEALTDFAERGQALLDQVQRRDFNQGDLRALLLEAEGITSSYFGDSPCGASGDRSSFRGAATELINSILFELSSDPDSLATSTLIELIVGGYRSGFFDGDDGAEELWLGEYEGRVSAALAGSDPNEVRRLATASEQLGRTDEARELWAHYEELEG